jgi:GNAT superfamily N-acetyltransferase
MATFDIRPATVDDADVIAWHRAAMFRDMGDIAAEDVEPLLRATAAWVRGAMPAGDYVAWMATPSDEPRRVIGGVGMQLRALIPRPRPAGRGLLDGRQGLIVNVFVEREYRRQGVARALTEAALDWGREASLVSIVLHASPAGRPLYEALGFVATNEMRYDRLRPLA